MADIINGYATLTAIKSLIKITAVDTADDGVINDLINSVSRDIDNIAGRRFYPRIETMLLNTPDERELYLPDDLLSVVTLTNGDAEVLTTADYILEPANYSPKYKIVLKQSSTKTWQPDSYNNTEQAISLKAWWGCRQHYAERAWVTATTLNEGAGLNATDLTFTVTSATLIKAGAIIKIDDEIMNVTAISTNDVTVFQRGDNGSTAATHVNGSIVYLWVVEPDIELACRMICRNFYHNRFGQNTSAIAQITAAGVILAPEDFPASAMKLIKHFERGA